MGHRLSRLLSYVLRHNPGALGVEMDPMGWVRIDELLARWPRRKPSLCLNHKTLTTIVTTDAKQRFALSPDRQRIRATNGHTVVVDLGYPGATPPIHLYHGTTQGVVGMILTEGLRSMRRTHVHLGETPETAWIVATRRPHPVVLRVNALAAHNNGVVFYQRPRGTWLTLGVPPGFIDPRVCCVTEASALHQGDR